MPLRYDIGDAADALFRTIIARRGDGYAVVGGCGVTVGDSNSDIVVDIASGTVRHDGSLVSVSAQSETLFDGDPQHYRKDLIYVDRNGDVQHVQGRATSYQPTDRRGRQAWSPPPPSGSDIDGIALATVLIPPGATDTDDLPTGVSNTTVVRDYRIGDVSAGGVIPERSADPDATDLDEPQVWLNTSRNSGNGEFRAYNSASEEVVTLSTGSASSVNPGQETVVESFDGDISANWNYVDTDDYTYGTPNIEGSAALQYDSSGPVWSNSFPGDGLGSYPEGGKTASLAIYYKPNSNEVSLGIAKDPGSDIYEAYFARSILSQDEFQIVRWDGNGSLQELGSTTVSFSSGNWYIVEIDYDGGGTGIHPGRVFSVSGGSRDTKIGEVAAPSQDTTYRGRGVEVRGNNEFAVDRYTLQDT